MNTGKVKFYNANKGYGFIIVDDENKSEIFFHCTKVVGREVVTDSLVQFEIENGKKGPVAINVKQMM
jgi:CspA family cold shock protein